jgi:hypothetical protein
MVEVTCVFATHRQPLRAQLPLNGRRDASGFAPAGERVYK